MRYEFLQIQTITETVLNFKIGKEVSFSNFSGTKTTVKLSRLICFHALDAKHTRVTYYQRVPVAGAQIRRVKDAKHGMLSLTLSDGTKLTVRKSFVKIFKAGENHEG